MQRNSLILVLLLSLSFNGWARSLQNTQISGRDELHKVDVIQEDGANKMLVKSTSVPEGLGNLVFVKAKNGTNENLAQNCGTVDQTFLISADPGTGADIVIQELRFTSLCSGIKIDKGLCGNQPWTDGILVRVTSEGQTFEFLPIKQTSQFDNHFSFGIGSRYELIFGSGADFMTAAFSPTNPFILKKGTTDKVEVICRDDLSQSSFIDFIAFGFRDI